MRLGFVVAALAFTASAVKLNEHDLSFAQFSGEDLVAASAITAGSVDRSAANAVDLLSTSIHDAKLATQEASANAVEGLSAAGSIASNAVQEAGSIDSQAVGTAASMAATAINDAALKTSNKVSKSAGNAVKQLNKSADSIVKTLNKTAKSASKIAKS